jgi:hypothetical protein
VRLLLAGLAFVVSCTDSKTTEPGDASTASGSRSSVASSAFAVEPTLMTVPTYDGSGQSVHPDVVAFDTPWHGSRYWLTMTPYPKSDQKLENPSILTSNDGVAVAVPRGLENPVVAPPRNSRNYNSDPELLYEPQTDRLVLFNRLVERKTNTVHVSTSRDGITWTEARAPFWEHDHQVVSPTVAPRSGASARMWYVNAGKKGCDATSTSVVMRTASDPTGLIVDTRWLGPAQTDLNIPGYAIWHIKARWIPEKSEYWMLISAFPLKKDGCHTDDLFFARSADGVHWTAYAEPILRHEQRNWTAAAVYRSTFLYDAASDELRMWISARGSDGAWRMGYARARYTSVLVTLESGQHVSPSLTTVFRAPATLRGEEP